MAIEASRRDEGRGGGLAGWRRYLYAANHRDIGAMFIGWAMLAMMVGAGLSLALAAPRGDAGGPVLLRAFDVLDGARNVVALVFCLLPAFVGLAVRVVPMVIGAPNLAFPRLGNFAFWLMAFAALLYFLSFKVPGDDSGLGFAGISALDAALAGNGAPGPAADFVLAALLLAFVAMMLMAMILITTILNFRQSGMSLGKLPLTPWSVLIASFVLLVTLPVLIAALAMLWADRHFGTVLFNPAGGGDVLIFRHLVWFGLNGIGWALAVAALGMAGEAIAFLSGKPGYGRRHVARALTVLALMGLAGWGRPLVADGLSSTIGLFFELAGLAALVPAFLTIVLLIGGLWKGAIVLRMPLFWALGLLPVFAATQLAGVMLDGPLAGGLRGGDFEAAYWQLLFALTPMFGLFAGWYLWFPRIVGCRPSESLAALHFVLTFAGALLACLPPLLLGLAEVPGSGVVTGALDRLQLPAEIGLSMIAAGTLLWPAGLLLARWRMRRAAAVV